MLPSNHSNLIKKCLEIAVTQIKNTQKLTWLKGKKKPAHVPSRYFSSLPINIHFANHVLFQWWVGYKLPKNNNWGIILYPVLLSLDIYCKRTVRRPYTYHIISEEWVGSISISKKFYGQPFLPGPLTIVPSVLPIFTVLQIGKALSNHQLFRQVSLSRYLLMSS